MSLDVNIDDVKYSFLIKPIHNIDGVLSNKDLKFLNKNLDQTLDFFNSALSINTKSQFYNFRFKKLTYKIDDRY